MVWDSFDHIDVYRTPLLDPAFDWLCFQRVAGGSVPDLPAGVHPIRADDLFVIVQEYQTRDSDAALWESHRRYIDIQLVTEGEELIEAAPVSRLVPSDPYDTETDKCRYTGAGLPFTLIRGHFLLFYPWDAHRCCMHAVMPQRVRKYCIKVRYDAAG